jgi:VWFA-related protein
MLRTDVPCSPGAHRRGLFHRARLLLAALPLLVAPAAPAQGPTGPAGQFGEILDVDVVLLDVVAVGRDGRLVTDLTEDEIEVREDGRPVSLQSFEPPAAVAGAPSPPSSGEAPTASAAPSDHHLVIFVDNAHTSGSNRDRFIQELWTFLNEDVPAGTEVLVASYGSRLTFLTDFTRDLSEVRTALLTALREPALQSIADGEQRQAIRTLQDRQRDAIEVGSDTPCGPNLQALAESFAGAAYDRTISAIQSLRFLVATLGGVEGSSALLHVSNGVPLVPGQPILDYLLGLCDGTGSQQGVAYAVDARSSPSSAAMLNPSALQMDMNRLSVEPELRRVTELATANRVRLYTIQVSPAPAAGAEAADGLQKTRTATARIFEERNDEDSLHFLAEETGGRSFLSGVGFDRDLDVVLDQVTGSYALSYVAPGERDGTSRRIEVSTSRPGVRILHPSHRTSKTRGDEVNDRLLAALHHGVTRHPDGAGITLGSAAEGGAPTRVRIRLPTETVTIPDGQGGRQGLLNLYLTARDPNGTSLGLRQKLHPVFLPPDAPVPATVSLEIDLGADLTGHEVAVAIHDQIQGMVWTFVESEPAANPGTESPAR